MSRKSATAAATGLTPSQIIDRRRLIMIVAGETGADVRTVMRVFDGKPVRGYIGAKIAVRLDELRGGKP